MKKRILTLVSILVVTSTTIMNSLSVYAQETNNDVCLQDEFIRTVDDYVEVNSEGLIYINFPKEFCEELGEYAEIANGIGYYDKGKVLKLTLHGFFCTMLNPQNKEVTYAEA